MNLTALHDLYAHQLQDMYSSEQQMLITLPKLAEAATDSELRQAFEDHLVETRSHLHSISELLTEMGVSTDGKVCRGMQGLIEESMETLNQGGAPAAIDAALILAAQKAEHYEIATYGALRAYAEILGHEQAEQTLGEILDQEHGADQALNDLAEGGLLEAGLNEQSVSGSSGS